jgi:hypothetical protein
MLTTGYGLNISGYGYLGLDVKEIVAGGWSCRQNRVDIIFEAL